MRPGPDGDVTREQPAKVLVHELNNVLSAVLGYAEIVHVDALAGNVEERDVLQVLAATRRAIELTDELGELISASPEESAMTSPAGSEPLDQA